MALGAPLLLERQRLGPLLRLQPVLPPSGALEQCSCGAAARWPPAPAPAAAAPSQPLRPAPPCSMAAHHIIIISLHRSCHSRVPAIIREAEEVLPKHCNSAHKQVQKHFVYRERKRKKHLMAAVSSLAARRWDKRLASACRAWCAAPSSSTSERDPTYASRTASNCRTQGRKTLYHTSSPFSTIIVC